MTVINPSYKIMTNITGKEIETIAKNYAMGHETFLPVGTFVKKALVERGEHILECLNLSVMFICDKKTANELVLYCCDSSTRVSTRCCSFVSDETQTNLSFVKPSFWSEDDPKDFKKMCMWEAAMRTSERTYLYLLDDGATVNQAKMILPDSLAVKIIFQANYAEVKNFLRRYTGKDLLGKARPSDLRLLSKGLLADLKQLVPIVFDDILVEE